MVNLSWLHPCKSVKSVVKHSELQARVCVAALRAGRGLSPGLLGVEVVAANAVERDLAPLGIIQAPIPSVIIDPQHGKNAQHQQAVENDIEREIRRRDHAAEFTRRS